MEESWNLEAEARKEKISGIQLPAEKKDRVIKEI
jgi:hypothetical protein